MDSEFEEKFVSEDEVVAGCGMIIKKSESFVCPYYCRRDEWDKKKKGFGPCMVDLQFGTNVCLYGLDYDF